MWTWVPPTGEFDLYQSNGSVSITVYWMFLWTQLVFHLHHQVPPHLGWSNNIMQNSGLLHSIIFLWCEAICMHYAWKRLHCNMTHHLNDRRIFCFIYLFIFLFCVNYLAPRLQNMGNFVFLICITFWSFEVLTF